MPRPTVAWKLRAVERECSSIDPSGSGPEFLKRSSATSVEQLRLAEKFEQVVAKETKRPGSSLPKR